MPDPFPTPPLLKPPSRPGATPPPFPQAWTATALLSPYRNEELFAASVAYDASGLDMRVTCYGVDGGAADLLFSGTSFWVLLPAGDPDPKAYGPFPAADPVPPPDWLAGRAMTLQGRGPLLGVDCDWWVGYSPNANGYGGQQPPAIPQVCNWVWTRAESGLPFRLFFNNADNPYGLPLLGLFAMTNFTAFAPAPVGAFSTEAARLRSAAALPRQAGLADAVAAARTMPDLLAAIAPLAAGAATPSRRASDLIPGLEPAPADAPLPAWTPRLCITGTTYPTAQDPTNPAAAWPMRVFYDWAGQRMLTRAALDVGRFDGVPLSDTILEAAVSYSIERRPDGRHVCQGTAPVGLPKPDWGASDAGIPKAVIRDNPVLGPGQVIHVTMLPSDSGRWFSVWYTDGGDGVLFMETPQFGDVTLVLVDYATFDHDPPPFPHDAFEVPPDCRAAPASP